MTDEARERLMEAVAVAVDAYVEDVSPREEPDTGHCDGDWDRPMDYDEFNSLSLQVPASVLSYVTGLSQASMRDFRGRRRSIPSDVASKLRRLHHYITELASERQPSLSGRKRMWQTEKKSK